MPHDIIVKDWSGLMQHLYDIPKGRHGRYRSDFVYRGLASKDWSLETSLKRLSPAPAGVEVPLLRNFTKYAKPGEIPSSHLLFKLAVAQHHGLPTRLMDWTVSPKVAAHFATFEEEHYDKDGVIWCAGRWRQRRNYPRHARLEALIFGGVLSIILSQYWKSIDFMTACL